MVGGHRQRHASPASSTASSSPASACRRSSPRWRRWRSTAALPKASARRARCAAIRSGSSSSARARCWACPSSSGSSASARVIAAVILGCTHLRPRHLRHRRQRDGRALLRHPRRRDEAVDLHRLRPHGRRLPPSIFVSRVTTTRSDMGTGLELDVITARGPRRHLDLRRHGHDPRHGAGTHPHPGAQERPGAFGRQGRRYHRRHRRGPYRGHPDRRNIRQKQRRLNSGGRLPRHPPVARGHHMGATEMKKLTLGVLLSLGLMSGSALAASAWTGGDDLPTNPLACDATPGAAVAKPYDGGVPTNAAGPQGQEDHRRRRSEADRHRLLQCHLQGHRRRRRRTRQRRRQDRRPDQGQHRRADHLHRQLHHLGRRRHPVRRQRSRGHRPGAEEGAGEGHQRRRL